MRKKVQGSSKPKTTLNLILIIAEHLQPPMEQGSASLFMHNASITSLMTECKFKLFFTLQKACKLSNHH